MRKDADRWSGVDAPPGRKVTHVHQSSGHFGRATRTVWDQYCRGDCEGGQHRGQFVAEAIGWPGLVERSRPVGQQCPHPSHPVHVYRSGPAETSGQGRQLSPRLAHGGATDRRFHAAPHRRIRGGHDPREAAGQQVPLRRFAEAPGVDGQGDAPFR